MKHTAEVLFGVGRVHKGQQLIFNRPKLGLHFGRSAESFHVGAEADTNAYLKTYKIDEQLVWPFRLICLEEKIGNIPDTYLATCALKKSLSVLL